MDATAGLPEPTVGTVALVTGASSGIGAATARMLAAGGTTVALVARRADRLEEVLAECLGTAPDSRAWPADLSDPEQAAALARSIWDAHGGVDVLVNNAGVPLRRPVQRLTLAEVERAMTINYLSPVAMTLALLPGMLERGRGTIVNVSSLGGRLGIATEIWDQPDNEPPLYSGPLVPAEEVASGIVACLTSPSFEHYLPDLKAVVEMKTADFDGFVAGMLAMADGQADDAVVARTVDPGSAQGG
jgi:NAD(P)-dependent dehydrogenase (short-subunit alcohol dehydrogenase family)